MGQDDGRPGGLPMNEAPADLRHSVGIPDAGASGLADEVQSQSRWRHADWYGGIVFEVPESIFKRILTELRTDHKAVAAKVAEDIVYKPNPRLGKALGRRIAEAIRAEGEGK